MMEEVDSETPEPSFLNKVMNIPIIEMNPYVTCGACAGYLVNCLTITECLHSFCRSCLLKHIETSLQCPVCDEEIHPTTPLANIKYDATKQDIVNRLLPHVMQEEKLRELDYYISRDLDPPSSQSSNHSETRRQEKTSTSSLVRRDRECLVLLVLEYGGAHEGCGDIEPLKKKFIRITSRATVEQIQKFLRAKLQVPQHVEISLHCEACELSARLSLQSVLDLYYQGEDTLMVLFYAFLLRDSCGEESSFGDQPA